ncbi:MAG: thioredoxin [Thermocladium sp.]|jgi:thioredoxin 1
MSNDEELNKILERKYKELTRPAEVSHLTKNNFDEFIKEHEVAVVDFWAPWCAPCFMLEPIIKQLAIELKDVGFGKVNSEEEPDIAARYYVMSLPTIIIFKNGEPVDTVIGVVPKKALLNRIMAVVDKQ